MTKILLVPAILLAMALFPINAALAAQSVTCEVVSINNTTVVLDCGSRANKLKKDTLVTVKKTKKNDLLPGC